MADFPDDLRAAVAAVLGAIGSACLGWALGTVTDPGSRWVLAAVIVGALLWILTLLLYFTTYWHRLFGVRLPTGFELVSVKGLAGGQGWYYRLVVNRALRDAGLRVICDGTVEGEIEPELLSLTNFSTDRGVVFAREERAFSIGFFKIAAEPPYLLEMEIRSSRSTRLRGLRMFKPDSKVSRIMMS